MVNHRILKLTNLTDADATKRLIAKVAGGGMSGLGEGTPSVPAALLCPVW